MIVTQTEVSNRLSKKPANSNNAALEIDDSDLWDIVHPGVEATVKQETRRLWEQVTWTYVPDIQRNQSKLLLPDFPVTTFTSLEYLSSVDSDGTETWDDYDAGDYAVDTDAGIIRLRYTCFPAGIGAIRAVFVTGFTAAQLQNPSTIASTPPTPSQLKQIDDVRRVKAVILSVVQREYALNKTASRHLRSFSDDVGGSGSYNFDFTFDELRTLRSLRRQGHC
jgi:hypothetical protein